MFNSLWSYLVTFIFAFSFFRLFFLHYISFTVFIIAFIITAILVYMFENAAEKQENYLINNKEIFSEEELKILSNLTKNYGILEEEKKREVYQEFYDKKLRKKFNYMKQVINQMITEKEISELNINLLNVYFEKLKLNYDEKKKIEEYFQKEI